MNKFFHMLCKKTKRWQKYVWYCWWQRQFLLVLQLVKELKVHLVTQAGVFNSKFVNQPQIEKYCRACASMSRSNSMFGKCRNLLRKPHCCQLTKNWALGTSADCQLTESELVYYNNYEPQVTAQNTNEWSNEELKFIEIEGFCLILNLYNTLTS